MFGMFAKPNLTLQERTSLLASLVWIAISAYLRHAWLSDADRAHVIEQWLLQHNRKAGAGFRYKISAAGDELAKVLVATQTAEELSEFVSLIKEALTLKPFEIGPATHAFNTLQEACERHLIVRGLAA